MNKFLALIFTLAALAGATSHSYFPVGDVINPWGASQERVVKGYTPSSLSNAKVVVFGDTAYGVTDTSRSNNPGGKAVAVFDFTRYRDPNSTLIAHSDSIVCTWTTRSKWAKIDSANIGFKYKAYDSTYSASLGTSSTIAIASGAIVNTRVAVPIVYGGEWIPYITGVVTVADSVQVLRLRCGDR